MHSDVFTCHIECERMRLLPIPVTGPFGSNWSVFVPPWKQPSTSQISVKTKLTLAHNMN